MESACKYALKFPESILSCRSCLNRRGNTKPEDSRQ